MLALELLKRQGIDRQVGELLPFGAQAAGEKLLAGEIDAAIMLISWDSPVARQLLADERVEVASFPHTDAYVALYPYLNKVVVPAGLGDLAKNRPAADVTLFAPKASLVVLVVSQPDQSKVLLATSHSLTLPSGLPLASVRSSGLKARVQTKSVWACGR